MLDTIQINKADRNSAIKLLTHFRKEKASEQELLKAVSILAKVEPDDELAIRVLILSLENPVISTAASLAISDLLRSADTKEEMNTLMRQVTAHIFDRYFDPKYAGHKLLDDIIEVAKDRMPLTADYIASLLLYSGNTGRKAEMVNSDLARSLVNFTNSDFLPDSQRSKKAFNDFNSELALRTLITPSTASNKYILKVLERFGYQNIEDVSYNIIAAHGALLAKVTYENAENKAIINQVINSLLKWSTTFSINPDVILEESIQIGNWRKSTIENPIELPNTTIQRIAYNHLLLIPIRDALIDQYFNIADKKKIFQILANIQNAKSNIIILPVCKYIASTLKGDRKKEDFPIEAAIDFLSAHLVGLNRFLQLTSEEQLLIFGEGENARDTPVIRAKDIKYAATILNTLIDIVQSDSVPIADRANALNVIVTALPNNLLSIINELKPIINSKPVLKTTLYKALGTVKYQESLPLLLSNWSQRKPGSSVENDALLGAIERIGTHKILGKHTTESGAIESSHLLKDVFEEKEASFRAKIENALRNKGFGYEIDRERRRREINQTSKEINQAAERIASNESKSQQLLLGMNHKQGTFMEKLFLMKRHIYQLDVVCTDKNLDLFETGIDGSELKGKLKALMKIAAQQNEEIGRIDNQVRTHQAVATELQKELKDIEKKIKSINSNIGAERKRIQNAQAKFSKAKTTIESATKEINNLSTQKRTVESNLRAASNKLDSVKQRKVQAENHLSKLKNASNSAELGDKINSAKTAFKNAKTSVNQQASNISNLKNEVNKLEKKRKKEEKNIERARESQKQANNDITQANNTINRLQSDYEQLERKRVAIPPKIKVSQQEIGRYEQLLRQQRLKLDEIRQQIGGLRSELKQVQTAQKKVVRSFEAESGAEKSTIETYRSQAKKTEESILEDKEVFNEANHAIEVDKTIYQRKLQELNEDRQDLDALGDKCFNETNLKHQEHEEESREKKLERIDHDLRHHLHHQGIKSVKVKAKFKEAFPKSVHISQNKQKNL